MRDRYSCRAAPIDLFVEPLETVRPHARDRSRAFAGIAALLKEFASFTRTPNLPGSILTVRQMT